MGRDDVLEQLYAADQESFVAERKRLERALRKQGREADADDIAARRKPPLPAFLANRLARERTREMESLIDGARALSGAQRKGDPVAMREAQSQLNANVRTLVSDASKLIGRPLSDDIAQRLSATLRAAAVDPSTVPLLRRGVLPDEIEPVGFAALAGMEIKPAKVPAKRRSDEPRAQRSETRGKQAEANRLARIEQLESELAEARDTLDTAERALAAAGRETDRARKRASELEARLARHRAAGGQ